MKIAYISTYDARNIHSWSGLGYYISRTLKSITDELYYIGPLSEKNGMFYKALTLWYRTVLKKNYLRHREPEILKGYARQAERRLAKLDADMVFSPGSMPLSYLDTDKPMVFWTDANFASMVDFYADYSGLSARTLRLGMEAEKRALEKCRLAIYASEWAARSAVERFGIDGDKVKVVPFGANIGGFPSAEEIKVLIESRPADTCRLLFLGIDWHRKGGEIAYRTAARLNEQGIRTELHIAGCEPDLKDRETGFLRLHGFLSKADRAQAELLNKLIREAHFLILPTRAEAYGVVFCEANSFGVPCLAARVGGVPTIIRDGKNGRLFDKDAPVDEYCGYITSLMDDRDRYRELARASYEEFRSRLNWDSAGRTVKKLLEGL